MGTKVGKPSYYNTWLKSQQPAVQERARYIQDFAKHGFKDLDEDALFSLRVAEALMHFGGRCYRAQFGKPTPLMFAFDIRLSLENPSIVKPVAEKVIAELGMIDNSAGITRQQFLEENLPIIATALSVL